MSWIHAPPPKEDSPRVLELLSEKEDLQENSHRAEQSLKALDGYLESLTSLTTQSTNLMGAITEYNTGAKVYQDEIRSLRDKLKKVDEMINEERLKLRGKARHPSLNMKASIGIFAETAGDVELGLVYGTLDSQRAAEDWDAHQSVAVTNATWEPKYDIRVDTQTKEKSVTLIYKGSITQNSGEVSVYTAGEVSLLNS